LIAMQWSEGGRRRWIGVAGVIASCFIVIACASATPVTGVMFALIGAAAFVLRYRMAWVRWGLLFAAIGLHMVMLAPIWHLVARINVSSGSSYHRFFLIDGAINHWDEWWLIGSRVGTAHWGSWTFDVTNHYIVQALHGGLPVLGLFVATIALAFREVGRIWRAEAQDRKAMLWGWALGVSLFVHVTGFIGISYFGQINLTWFLLLAMIGSIASYVVARPTVVRAPVRRRRRRRAMRPIYGVSGLPVARPVQAGEFNR